MKLGHLGALLFTASSLVAASQSEDPNAPGSQEGVSKKQRLEWLNEAGRRRSAAVDSGGGGYLLDGGRTDLRLNASDVLDARLLQLLDSVGPDMRPLRDFKDPADVGIALSRRAWILMREHAREAALKRMSLIRPLISEALEAAQVGEPCRAAANQVLEATARLDSWAIQLLNSWGNFPPTGIFEGTFGDIGSFHGCVNVPDNPAIDHAHYCTLAYRPVLPSRGDYQLIVDEETQSLEPAANRSRAGAAQGEDAFKSLFTHSQYSHYIYYKLGTCFPIACSPADVQKLAKLVGRRAILMSGPVKCHSNRKGDYTNGTEHLQISTRNLNDGLYIWKPHITDGQWAALLVVAGLLCLILFLTLVDLIANRLPGLLEKSERLSSDSTNSACHTLQRTELLGHIRSSNLNGPVSGGAQVEKVAQVVVGLDANNNNNSNNSRNDRNNNHEGSQGSLKGNQLEGTDRIYEFHEEETCLSKPAVRSPKKESRGGSQSAALLSHKPRSKFANLAHQCSIVTSVGEFLDAKESHGRNDILCLHGIRCITMCWIVLTHTMQYNDWSGFARTREVETHLKSLINQPLFNGSYLVDTFFLISGLLTSFSSFRNSERRFSARAYLIGRYLRLTPQALFISLLFILLPLANLSGGPHWYTITGEYSENCTQNWWLNLFFVQAFYRSSEMCNFASWWISVDMFYHLFALLIILIVLRFGRRRRLLVGGVCFMVALAHAIPQALIHYLEGMPPNLLSTIPQTGAMWSKMTLQMFWTPLAHALPFFLGFYLGHLMASHSDKLARWFTPRRAKLGWLATGTLLALQLYSTYFWVTGRWRYTRLSSTLYFMASPLVWSSCLAWTILACQYKRGGPIDRMLSLLFTFFGSQNLLLEPTQLLMLYVIVGNIALSMLLGSLLCVIFELPWLKGQRWLMRFVR